MSTTWMDGARAMRRNVVIAVVGVALTAAVASVGAKRGSSSPSAGSAAVAPATVVMSSENGPTGYFPDRFDSTKAKRVEGHVQAF